MEPIESEGEEVGIFDEGEEVEGQDLEPTDLESLSLLIWSRLGALEPIIDLDVFSP